MFGNGGGPALGPPAEWFRYPTVGQWRHDHDVFWATVQEIITSYPGDYDDLPTWCTEDAVELLAMHD